MTEQGSVRVLLQCGTSDIKDTPNKGQISMHQLQVFLQRVDDLPTMDKVAGPNVSIIIERFHRLNHV